MKKMFMTLLALLLCLSLVGCGNDGDAPVVEGGDDQRESEVVYKAALITTSARGNDFIDLMWSGFEKLETEGWEVKCIEALDSAEYADDIRAMSEEGYNVIMTWTDDLSEVVLELADELKELYPNTHYFLLDTYMEQNHDNCTTVSVDAWESSFVAGYIAAKTTQTKEIGWVSHFESPKMRRFWWGFVQGAKYADPTVTCYDALTLDAYDPQKGLETAQTLLADHPNIDVVYQAAYLAGPGVITACANAGIKCIGVDDWQGYIDDCVFWSAVKSIDNAVYALANSYKAGEKFPLSMDFNLSKGGKAYDDRDFVNLTPEMQKEITDLCAGIADGSVNVYDGMEDWILEY